MSLLSAYPNYRQGLDDVAELTRMLVARGRRFNVRCWDNDDGTLATEFDLLDYVTIDDVRALDEWTGIQPAARRIGFSTAPDHVCYVSVRWRGEGVE